MLQLPEGVWSLANCSQRNQRDELARFWLFAPEDLLPSLWSSPVGEVTKSLIKQLSTQTEFTHDQVELRNAIGDRLQQGLQMPMAPQLMLANFLYSPPGLLRIANADAELPDWLLSDYKELYEEYEPQPQNLSSPEKSAGDINNIPQPDFGDFPATLQELVSNRIQLNRLLGLSNLYYIDPEDQEILQELRLVRLSLIKAIKCCSEHQLESIWASDVGDRYWALIRSGIQKEPLTPDEQLYKDEAIQLLNPSSGGGFGQPGALNAFLISMTLFEPGSMRVADAEQKLPSWLFQSYQQIFADSLADQS